MTRRAGRWETPTYHETTNRLVELADQVDAAASELTKAVAEVLDTPISEEEDEEDDVPSPEIRALVAEARMLRAAVLQDASRRRRDRILFAALLAILGLGVAALLALSGQQRTNSQQNREILDRLAACAGPSADCFDGSSKHTEQQSLTAQYWVIHCYLANPHDVTAFVACASPHDR